MAEFTNLGKFLKKKRSEKKLTQKDLALALGGMNSQFVSNWERGLCAPPSHSVEDLIQILKINRQALVNVMLADARISIEARILKKSPKKNRD
jgi:transcriptional regulator with XRE-family HTH domain